MNNKKIILFDGVCNFCNFWVNFIIDHDKKDFFRFAALQSETGQNILKQINLKTNNFWQSQGLPDSLILVDKQDYFIKSSAALIILKHLSGFWKILFVFIIIPRPIRNFIYDLIAKNRYKIFGKKDVCRIPNEKEKGKFI